MLSIKKPCTVGRSERFIPYGVHPRSLPPGLYDAYRKTANARYVNFDDSKRDNFRSKMPYIRNSRRKYRGLSSLITLPSENKSSLFNEDSKTDKPWLQKVPHKNNFETQKEVIKPEIQFSETACNRPGFGICSQRFMSSKNEPQSCAPPPGTYTPHVFYSSLPGNQIPKIKQPFSLSSMEERKVAPVYKTIGPAVYSAKGGIDDMLKDQMTRSSGRFELNSEKRSRPIKYGYFAPGERHQQGPSFTEPINLHNRFFDRANSFKGVFMRSPQRSKKLWIGTLTHRSPCLYNPVNVNFSKTEVASLDFPFNNRRARMTDRDYAKFIGNLNSFSAPGRYTYARMRDNWLKGGACSVFDSTAPVRVNSGEPYQILCDRLRTKGTHLDDKADVDEIIQPMSTLQIR